MQKYKLKNKKIMIITIILTVLFITGILILQKSYDYDVLGMILAIFSGLYLIIHLFVWGLSSYDYSVFENKRNAFVSTLELSRESDNKYESAAILKDISEWNQTLELYKYQNGLFLLTDYVDDRFMLLEPIK